MKRMKTYMTLLGASIILSGSMAACGLASNGSDIGKEKAEEIALNDVGITREDTSRFRISKDHDDGLPTYDIQFTYDNMEYEYEIQASDGTILDTSTEPSENASASAQADSQKPSAQADSQESSSPDSASTHKNASNGITWEEAAALALERVSGATQNDLRMNLDFDDGYETYEGDIIYNQIEYEFEIDAATGKFLEWSEERH
ncbi:PepSY domain-containing protein [Coprococcus sp. AF21-14LB]|uniref:PepSY domain-containing protein n=1 Tax=Coprococcus sp. AF21-14LB TaxID=2292231 RepID=UPI001FA85E61|nr:PepSY domain-containing protein [Coprococcus sp. AF21-14LB]